jgi:hypothetical protein
MPYPTLLGHVIPYHIDGTVVIGFDVTGAWEYTVPSNKLVEINDEDLIRTDVFNGLTGNGSPGAYLTFFFPEQREIQGLYIICDTGGPYSVQGSNDSTNGFDGTWEAASAPSGLNNSTANADTWRRSEAGNIGYKAISFSGAKRVLRIGLTGLGGGYEVKICHIYGKKGSGQTPDDIVFLDAEDSDAEFTIPLDFGDRPAGTSVVRQIKIQNTSATLTANTIDLQLNHADFTFSTSPTGPWAAHLVISSLAPTTKSSVIYIKNTTQIPPADLGPYRAPLIATVGSWT